MTPFAIKKTFTGQEELQGEQWLVAPSEGRAFGGRRARQDRMHGMRRDDV